MARNPATKLTIEYLQKQGYHVDICERHIPMKPFPIKKDLFGCFDLVAIKPRHVGSPSDAVEVHFIQTTSFSNRAARRRKIEAAAEVVEWLTHISGVVISLITWKKVNGKYIVHVQRGKLEYGPDQKDHLVLRDTFFISMELVRAGWRKKHPTRAGEKAKSATSGSRIKTASTD